MYTKSRYSRTKSADFYPRGANYAGNSHHRVSVCVSVYVCVCHTPVLYHKNSSGDEIANVNFLRRYGTYVLQNTKKENLLRLTN